MNIWMIGDSTMANKKSEVAPETGWGMVLQGFFNEEIKVHNHAVNGRSSKSFMSEGRWKSVYDSLKPGDYVIIQFGHNDEKTDSVRHTEPFTTYKQQMKTYIDQARSKEAIPVICSPIVRRHFDAAGNLIDTHGYYIKAAREIAAETNTPFVDMEAKTRKLVADLGPERSKSLYLFCKPGEFATRPDGVKDSTHLNNYGAHQVANLFVEGIKELQLPVALYLSVIPSRLVAQEKYVFTVAQDNSGDFATVQAAIDAAKAFPDKKITVFIKNGIYKEKVHIPSWNNKLSLIGESVEHTIISYDDFFNKLNRGRNSTFYTYTMLVEADNFHAENLTIENTAGRVGQAVALHVEGDRCSFHNCRILGNQDTLYAAGQNSRQYFDSCYIEGTTDFIFGAATAVFVYCTVHSKSNSFITAASTPEGKAFGYVFLNCNLTADSGINKVYLGRPWRDYAKVALLYCSIGAHILPAGWDNWSTPDREKTTFFAEYENTGPGAVTSQRVIWSHQLSKKEAGKYSPENILKSCISKEPSFIDWIGKQEL